MVLRPKASEDSIEELGGGRGSSTDNSLLKQKKSDWLDVYYLMDKVHGWRGINGGTPCLPIGSIEEGSVLKGLGATGAFGYRGDIVFLARCEFEEFEMEFT